MLSLTNPTGITQQGGLDNSQEETSHTIYSLGEKKKPEIEFEGFTILIILIVLTICSFCYAVDKVPSDSEKRFTDSENCYNFSAIWSSLFFLILIVFGIFLIISWELKDLNTLIEASPVLLRLYLVVNIPTLLIAYITAKD